MMQNNIQTILKLKFCNIFLRNIFYVLGQLNKIVNSQYYNGTFTNKDMCYKFRNGRAT